MKLECNFIFLVDSPFPTRNCCCIGEFIMIVIILWWSSVLVYLESCLCFEMKKLCVWFWKAYFGSSEGKMEKTCLWTTTFCLSSMETPLRKCEIFYTWCSFVNAKDEMFCILFLSVIETGLLDLPKIEAKASLSAIYHWISMECLLHVEKLGKSLLVGYAWNFRSDLS